MPGFTVTRRIAAPVETVWQVLDDFGEIQRWSPGVRSSELTSERPVAEGSTRHCAFAPFGAVNERIERYEPPRRMTVRLYETFGMPISGGTADFALDAVDGGSHLTLRYDYTPNLLGRLLGPITARQMRKGIAGLAASLRREAERLAG